MVFTNTRWAFDVSTWTPTEEQIFTISSFIQPEEKQRISKFVFMKDAKSSLVGRLLIRKYLCSITNIPYNCISIGRDELGKPYLLDCGNSTVEFNVSHQADFVVLAGNTKQKVGVDIMKNEPLVNKNITEFFRLMRKQLSNTEWKKIENYKTDSEKLACFYRIWCLKESFLKNTGKGVASFPLENLSFSIQDELKLGKITTSTKLYMNNIIKNYVFEETMLNESYIIAVALENSDSYEREDVQFEFLKIDDILNGGKPLSEPDSSFVCNFLGKKEKPY